MSPAASETHAVRDRDLPWVLAVFIATLWFLCHAMGTSPAVWEDTIIEDLTLRDCVVGDHCTAVGLGATVGIFHSAGYLHLRTLLYVLGLHANGTFRAFLTANALGVALTALAARRLGGRTAGALAALLAVATLGRATQLNVITDVSPMPFLGAVFLLLGVQVVTRRDVRLTALLGVVAGVMVNVYATGGLAGLSAVLIALRIPTARWRHAAVAALAFAGSAFTLSPYTWLTNARILVEAPHLGRDPSILGNSLMALPVARLTLVAAVVGVSAWLRPMALRARLAVPLAVVLPLVVPYAIGVGLGRIDPQPKYFSHVIPAVATVVALGAVTVFRALWARAGMLPARQLVSLVRGVVLALTGVAALAVAGLLRVGPAPLMPMDSGDPGGLINDLMSVPWWLGQQTDPYSVPRLALDALAVLLATGLARSLGGLRAAGVTALCATAALVALGIGSVPWTVAVLPTLGGVYLLVAQRTVRHATPASVAVLAVCAAALASVEPTAALYLVSVVALALRVPRQRGVHTAAAVVTWTAVAVVLHVPAAVWVMMDGWRHGPAAGFGHAVVSLPVVLPVVAAVGWTVAAARMPELRARSDIPASVVWPCAVVGLALAVKGVRTGDGLSAVDAGATAVTLGVLLDPVIHTSWHRLAAVRRWITQAVRHGGLATAAPYGAACVIATGWVHPRAPQQDPTGVFSAFTFQDLQAVSQALGGARHWSWARAAVNLKTTDEIVRRVALYGPDGWRPSGDADTLQRAYLLRVPPQRMPRVLPASMVRVGATGPDATVVTLGCSWINWRAFRACVQVEGQAEPRCEDSGIPTVRDGHHDYQYGVPGLPRPERLQMARQTLTLRFPLHPSTACPDEWVHMPTQLETTQVCPGEIVGIDGRTDGITDDGRTARLHYDPGAPDRAPRELAIAWTLGTVACEHRYHGTPPFFLEGEPQAVEPLIRVLRPRVATYDPTAW